MAIVQTVNADMFIRAFDEMNRSDNFSREARYALFDYYEEYSESTGEHFELDVIAICCEWSECTVQDCVNEYQNLFDPKECCDGDRLDYIESVLENETFVIRLDNTLLIQAF